MRKAKFAQKFQEALVLQGFKKMWEEARKYEIDHKLQCIMYARTLNGRKVEVQLHQSGSHRACGGNIVPVDFTRLKDMPEAIRRVAFNDYVVFRGSDVLNPKIEYLTKAGGWSPSRNRAAKHRKFKDADRIAQRVTREANKRNAVFGLGGVAYQTDASKWGWTTVA